MLQQITDALVAVRKHLETVDHASEHDLFAQADRLTTEVGEFAEATMVQQFEDRAMRRRTVAPGCLMRV